MKKKMRGEEAIKWPLKSSVSSTLENFLIYRGKCRYVTRAECVMHERYQQTRMVCYL